MTTDQVFTGLALIVVLAVGSQVPAGGAPWVVDLGLALRSAGLEVALWAGREEERERITAAGLELAPGELFAAATGAGAELEGLTGSCC
ncbi:hypothetical protein [Streptomyces sp. NPDC096132]|uniref:hypothetical protein n=1 Tax=Streptomyces sp. NPDC096132 TaxID=3366075 RepID=UPI00381B4179